MKNQEHFDSQMLVGLVTATEVVVDGYHVTPKGLFSPYGHCIGTPLLCSAVKPGDPVVLLHGIDGQDKAVQLCVGGVDHYAVATALGLLGYRAEPGRMLEAADYVVKCWNGGYGARSTRVFKGSDVVIEFKARGEGMPEGSVAAPGPKQAREEGYLAVRDIPWLGRYFKNPEDPGLRRALGRKLSAACRRAGVQQSFVNFGVHSEGLYPGEVVEDLRSRLEADPACMANHR